MLQFVTGRKFRTCNRCRLELNVLLDTFSFNYMRMLLAMQNHDKDAQKEVEKQMEAVRAEMDLLMTGRR